MNFTEIIHEIELNGIMPDRPPSLEPMHDALSALRLQTWPAFSKHKVIVVAGTNGKGSTCKALETLCRLSGDRTGFYSSPHLQSYLERFQIDGHSVSEEIFCKTYVALKEKLNGFKIKNKFLSHFEILTVMAVEIFFGGRFSKPVDRAIFEVGLGGLWDATNAIEHSTSVITRLGFDHQNLLGNTLVEIAKNKFGIVGPENKVFHTAFENPEIESLARQTQKKTNSQWVEAVPFQFGVRKSQSEKHEAPVFYLKTPWGDLENNLIGARGAQNASLALSIYKELSCFDPQVLTNKNPLAQIQWPGRMQKISKQNARTPVYISGDHNPQGVRSLQELVSYFDYENIFFIVGIGRDKETDEILNELKVVPRSKILLTETPFRGLKISEYSKESQAQALAASPRLSEVLEIARNSASTQDMIVITGSLYLAGQALTELKHL